VKCKIYEYPPGVLSFASFLCLSLQSLCHLHRFLCVAPPVQRLRFVSGRAARIPVGCCILTASRLICVPFLLYLSPLVAHMFTHQEICMLVMPIFLLYLDFLRVDCLHAISCSIVICLHTEIFPHELHVFSASVLSI
jgi:hypothetical protein